MKRVILIGLVLGLFTSYSYAQTGGMMGGQKGEMEKGQMMEQKEVIA